MRIDKPHTVRRVTLAFALAGLLPGYAGATDGYFADGYGMKSIGMAGATAAVAQEPFGGANNPAAMSFLDNQWQLGVSWFRPVRSASRSGSGMANVDGTARSESEDFFIPEFGINWKFSPTLALGLTVYGNGGMNTNYPGGQIPAQSACYQFNPPNPNGGPPYNLMCGNGNLGVDLTQLIFAPYLAWQPVAGQSVGIAPLLGYQRFKASGMQAFDNPAFSTHPGNVTNNGYDDSWGAGVRIGYMGQFTESFAVGASWSSKIAMGSLDKYRGLFANEGAFDIPSSLLVGVAYRPTPAWLIAVDFERIFYDDVAAVSNPSAYIGYCAPTQMGGAGLRDYCLGGSSGAGFGWQNIDVWKIGLQYALNEAWTLRAGYQHSDSPVRAQDVTFNILAPGIMTNQYSLGATWKLDTASEITGALMYAPNATLTGTSLLVGFGLPPTTTETVEMKQYQLGIAYSRRF